MAEGFFDLAGALAEAFFALEGALALLALGALVPLATAGVVFAALASVLIQQGAVINERAMAAKRSFFMLVSGVVHHRTAETNGFFADDFVERIVVLADFQDLPAQAADREVQIYRRANGDVGVRNELWILPTVGCVNGIARQIQNRFLNPTARCM